MENINKHITWCSIVATGLFCISQNYEAKKIKLEYIQHIERFHHYKKLNGSADFNTSGTCPHKWLFPLRDKEYPVIQTHAVGWYDKGTNSFIMQEHQKVQYDNKDRNLSRITMLTDTANKNKIGQMDPLLRRTVINQKDKQQFLREEYSIQDLRLQKLSLKTKKELESVKNEIKEYQFLRAAFFSTYLTPLQQERWDKSVISSEYTKAILRAEIKKEILEKKVYEHGENLLHFGNKGVDGMDLEVFHEWKEQKITLARIPRTGKKIYIEVHDGDIRPIKSFSRVAQPKKNKIGKEVDDLMVKKGISRRFSDGFYDELKIKN